MHEDVLSDLTLSPRCVIGYITFFLRVYTRLRYAVWGTEDWTMTAALPLFTVLSVACIACSFTGIGVKAATLALPRYEQYTEKGLFVSFTVAFLARLIDLC